MEISISNEKNKTWVFFFLMFFTSFLLLFSKCLADPRISVAGLYCGSQNFPARTSSIPTFVKEMEGLSQTINSHNWATQFTNSTTPIYSLAQCFKDLSQTDCLLCFAASRTRLPRCLPAVSARIYLDGCFLRYDNYSFYQESTDPVLDRANCSSSSVMVDDESGRVKFVRDLGFFIGNLTWDAVKNGGFSIAEGDGMFGLAQCWKTVGSDGCRACLKKAAMAVRKCGAKREGRALNAGCYLRYSTDKFYNDKEEAENTKGFSKSKGAIIAIILAGTAFLMLSLSGAYAAYARLSKNREERNNLRHVSFSVNRSGLNFKYETLEKATDYFNPSRKIGQGGAGSVYKGTLRNGKTIAVKRLIFNTSQWVDEFFNEVNLISVIQHKNLVKLLGCSIEGPESLLVYEYVHNKSLDQFLFEKNKVQLLNWQQRSNIIVGTAEGLAYLHGGSKTRIIHRDIKSSNVLLDENMTPKIADFGLVRDFAADKTHISTGIAGTLGYMAPEYLTRGQLTDKADVYSFGVLVLEIVCGRRNSTFTEDSTSLLQKVWKLYKSSKLLEAVDPFLNSDFPAKDVCNVLQIGLLCTQASAVLRPSMAEVVSLLTDKEKEIPAPKQPPFLNASVFEPTSSNTRSSSTQSFVSNTLTKGGASYTSSEVSSSTSLDGASKSERVSAQVDIE